jgi:hypothetical protein
MIAFEAFGKPFTTPLVILEEKYSNRMTARVRAGYPKLVF